ncbi:MAG TPA: hypothetical protein VKV17_13840 [Bryobacteraceae bacterium]|nr:hypothetical protein [Bryobacteraceae bacterium]
MRLPVLALLPFFAINFARADVLQSTTTLPPPAGAYDFSSICLSSGPDRCLVDPVLHDFSNYSQSEVAGNELVSVDAVYSADVYTNNGGTPGTLLGPIELTGTLGIVYSNRNPSFHALGTFDTQVVNFDLTGTFDGNTFEVIQNPSLSSTGVTTILPADGSDPNRPLYDVSGYLDINGEYSFNGSPFLPGPPRMGTLTPEPASGALGAAILAVLLSLASLRQRDQQIR